MKTPEEIKRALEYCNMLTNRKNICESCPYNGECTETGKPDQPGWDALLYIQRLEGRIAQMKEQMRGLCPTCKHKDEYGQTCQECLFLNAHERPHWEYDELPERMDDHEKPV